ncbi:MAG TPA: ATP-binding cassette domain-containing protein [Trueperaceae bacterium]|nr:ATP-binding cassette domain-containing protein [Trueperaceae bacterium]
MSDTAIHAQGVRKSFGSVQALDGVSLDAPRGKVFGLLGPNGAGKTTLVRILTTLLLPDEGEATVLGHDVRTDREALRPRIGLAGQYAAVDENLTGRENLVMVGRLYHLGRREARRRADEVLARFQLEDAAGRTAKTYSGGMRRRLDLAASLVGRPEVLFLDEPTTGLDPRSRRDMWALIKELVSGGATLLLTTQYLEEADVLADRIAVVDHGRVIAEGTSDELKARLARDYVEVGVERPDDLGRAVDALEDVGGEAQVEREALRVSLPAPNGARTLLEAVRRLDAADVGLVDVGLRRPSLDEVFLALTGHEAREDQREDQDGGQDGGQDPGGERNAAHRDVGEGEAERAEVTA